MDQLLRVRTVDEMEGTATSLFRLAHANSSAHVNLLLPWRPQVCLHLSPRHPGVWDARLLQLQVHRLAHIPCLLGALRCLSQRASMCSVHGASLQSAHNDWS